MSRTATPADVLSGAARWCVVEGDALAVLATLPDGCVDALVTDPPSGIAFMGAEWDRDKGGRAQWVAWLSEVLGLARAATRDGGRSLVWSLPRTSHWTGCAVEDAGWSIETTITHLFGTGWPKGQSQLKPAAETWWLARTGRSEALNIEACRIAHKTVNGGNLADNPHLRGQKLRAAPVSTSFGRAGDVSDLTAAEGRYPPNVVLSHSPGCNGVCVEGCPVRELDAQSGESTSTDRPRFNVADNKIYGAAQGPRVTGGFSDTGGASRFFPQFPADEYALFGYHAKPSRAERDAGVSLDAAVVDRYGAMGQGPLPQQTPRAASVQGNNHPTVKSIALMRWLARLVTRPGDVVLDPFGGSGTTGVAALCEGRRVILVEREPRFAEIARQRCESVTFDLGVPVRAAPKAAPVATDPRQLSLLGGAP